LASPKGIGGDGADNSMEEALAVVRAAHPYVNFWKVGKLNHNKAVESLVD